MEILSVGRVLQSDHIRLITGFDCPFLSITAVTLVLDGDTGRFAARLVGKDQSIRHAGDVERLAHVVKSYLDESGVPGSRIADV